MRQHVFEGALAIGDLSDLYACLASHALISAGFQKFTNPNPTGIASRTAGGQNVIRSNRLVAIGYRGFLADEKRAVVLKIPKVEINVLDL
jgi:hypothetical protein